MLSRVCPAFFRDNACMTKLSTAAVLFAAAALEAGGDALIRIGLRQHTGVARGVFLLGGALILFAYGLTVNAPAWDFGRLLGIYVVFFFVVAQLISTIVFHQPPSRFGLAGGALIVAGGCVLALG